MDGINKRVSTPDSSSKKSKSKKNRIGVYGDSTNLINTGNEMEMDSLDEQKKNNTKVRLKKMLNKNFKSKNPILFFSNVMQNAQRWKSYATSRRKLVSADAKGPGEQANRRCTGGDGLTPELSSDTNSSKDHVDGRKESKAQQELKNINNRNLIEYFARISQSKKPDECVNLEYVHSLLANGADIKCNDKYGQTVLHEAARAWDVDVARFLVECGAGLDQGDYRGRTALHVAAAVDYPEMVDYLVEAGANKESKTKEELQTPVHFAARNDARGSLKALVKNNCEYKEVRDYKGRTPLHVAAELDRSETARMLLELDDPAPAGVKDYSGQAAIVWMITKMPPVAKLALDQFHTTDRANRKQYYHLNWLEPRKPEDPDSVAVYPQTAMQVLIAFRQYELVTHATITRLINVKWTKFGKVRAIFQTITNFIFILLWTSLGVFIDYNDKHNYILPDHWWRILLLVLALIMGTYQIKDELSEYFYSKKSHSRWKEWRENEIKRDLEFVHNRWPEEEQYLKQEIDDLDNLRPQYFNDFWNIFDWICYTLLLICVITHVVDIFAHGNFIARLHIRLTAVTIILIWLRLLKNARAFSTLGPFIVIVGHMVRDIFKFGILYLSFFLPYACAFWMLFGGDKIPERYQGQPWGSNYTVTVDGMDTPNALLFSLFRLTLVDEYAYSDMKAVDSLMADILVGTWLSLSAIVMLNLFIALMSDTFQRVFDNANANAIMQKAITILTIEEGLSSAKRKKFRRFIHEKCSPEKDYYDDDATEVGGEDLQKVTIQIKDQLDELCEDYYEDRLKNKSNFDSPDGDSEDNDDTDDDSGGENGKPGGNKAVTKREFELEMERVQDDMNEIIDQQGAMIETFQRDMKKVMGLLEQIALSSISGGLTGSARSMVPPNRPPTGRPPSIGHDPNLLYQRPISMDFGEPVSTVVSLRELPALMPSVGNATGAWVSSQEQPQNTDAVWDDLDQKRKKDLHDLRSKLAKQQKIAARKSKKLGRRKAPSDSDDHHHTHVDGLEVSEDAETVVTETSVLPDSDRRGNKDPTI